MEGPEQIETYVRLALSKFVHAQGYSEVNLERMTNIIRKYLITDYNNEIQDLASQIRYNQDNHIPINRDYFHNESQKCKAKLLRKIEELCWMGD